MSAAESPRLPSGERETAIPVMTLPRRRRATPARAPAQCARRGNDSEAICYWLNQLYAFVRSRTSFPAWGGDAAAVAGDAFSFRP